MTDPLERIKRLTIVAILLLILLITFFVNSEYKKSKDQKIKFPYCLVNLDAMLSAHEITNGSDLWVYTTNKPITVVKDNPRNWIGSNTVWLIRIK